MKFSLRNQWFTAPSLIVMTLVGLLSSQLAVGGHHFEHQADDLYEPCQICYGYGQIDDVLTESGVPGAADLTMQTVPTITEQSRTTVRTQHYIARAPPQFPDFQF